MQKQNERITIHDVANSAGVSVSTVSRVLNDKDDVAENTKERVQKVIDQLGYASNLAARSMRSRKTNLIGLIVPDVGESYTLEVLKGCNHVIREEPFDLLIYTTGNIQKNSSPAKEQHYVNLLNGGLTDGLILIAPVANTLNSPSPMVVIDPNESKPDYPSVIATNRDGAMKIMDYLTSLGHQRIGIVGGRPELMSAVHRLQGYKDGLTHAGITVDENLIEIGDYSVETGKTCALKLLSLPDPPTAIFAANDQSAFGVIQAAKERGLRIPQDLSVVGFDNIPESKISNPALTTVDQHLSDLGTTAIQILMKQIKGDDIEVLVQKIPTELIVRDSCQAI